MFYVCSCRLGRPSSSGLILRTFFVFVYIFSEWHFAMKESPEGCNRLPGKQSPVSGSQHTGCPETDKKASFPVSADGILRGWVYTRHGVSLKIPVDRRGRAAFRGSNPSAHGWIPGGLRCFPVSSRSDAPEKTPGKESFAVCKTRYIS